MEIGSCFPMDETPTPTRFIRNCEEVGLFQDLQRIINPFEETFKIAVQSSSRNSVLSITKELNNEKLPNNDTLNTPSLTPIQFERVVNTESQTESTTAVSDVSTDQNEQVTNGEFSDKNESADCSLISMKYVNSVSRPVCLFDLSSPNEDMTITRTVTQQTIPVTKLCFRNEASAKTCKLRKLLPKKTEISVKNEIKDKLRQKIKMSYPTAITDAVSKEICIENDDALIAVREENFDSRSCNRAAQRRRRERKKKTIEELQSLLVAAVRRNKDLERQIIKANETNAQLKSLFLTERTRSTIDRTITVDNE